MRSVVWTGHLQFGLVVMPVSLYVAARQQTTRFKRMHRRNKRVSRDVPGTWADINPADDPTNAYGQDPRVGQFPMISKHNSERCNELIDASDSADYEYSPVRQVLQSESTGDEIGPDELVKGYEYEPNQFAIIEPSAIDQAAVETSETIEVFHFVKADQVDPLYFERSYYLVPNSEGEKAYALLLEAMRKERSFGIARIAMHKREHMLILRPANECIIAHTMFYVNEIRTVPEFPLDRTLINDKEMRVASALIQGYSGAFEPEKFKDIYQDRIRALIDQQLTRNGAPEQDVTLPSEVIVPDLMQSIRQSLKQIEAHQSTKATVRKARRKSPQKQSVSTSRRNRLAGTGA